MRKRNVLRTKYTKATLLLTVDAVTINGPVFVDIESQPAKVKVDIRGAVWVELVAPNLNFILSFVQAKSGAGGVREPKRTRRASSSVDSGGGEDHESEVEGENIPVESQTSDVEVENMLVESQTQ